MISGGNAQAVRVDLKVKKLDEWTKHVDLCATDLDKQEFFYNGKFNKLQFSDENIKVKKKQGEPVSLRWEFAPDEFDNFEQVLQVLSRDRWKQVRDHERRLTYYVNPRTQERVWLE
jgi:hypothetical protein